MVAYAVPVADVPSLGLGQGNTTRPREFSRRPTRPSGWFSRRRGVDSHSAMKTEPKLNLAKGAEALGAERRVEVRAGSGYFGAMQAASEVETRLRAERRLRHEP
jgi:hypothetical protein